MVREMQGAGGRTRGRLLASFAATAVVAALVAALPARGPAVDVVVRGEDGAQAAVVAAVHRAGGQDVTPLDVVDGVAATVPATAVTDLDDAPGVAAVTVDDEVALLSDAEAPSDAMPDDWQDETPEDYDAGQDLGSLYHVAKAVGAHDAWSQRVTGEGVGVALIDSGVVPVEGLTGQVVNGPDLSFESQDPDLAHLDGYGHGTHMAGIIAGRDSTLQQGNEHDARKFAGIAPDAHVVNVKVATASGAADVSQVIAAIDWVVAHRDDPEMNVRVLNLSFGTDGTQDAALDPLSYAVEAAWHHGIVVVVAAGNDGIGTPLRNPARNPFVLAVGAADHVGTNGLSDDVVADFSNTGDAARRVDLVAPGKSIASLRAPGSLSDVDHPGARTGTRFFRGSGTSQSTAVVSGAVALLLDARPGLTPDQVKDLLTRAAAPMPLAAADARGAGQLDVKRALESPAMPATQSWTRGSGLGSLDLARGTDHLQDDEGDVLTGEQDIFGVAWDAPAWAAAADAGTSWTGGTWNGSAWTGDCWCATTWAGRSWNGRSWNATSWSGRSWNGRSWNGRSWNGRSWNGVSWDSGG